MADDQRAMVQQIFDATAETYDHVGVDFFQPIAAGLLAEVAPQPGERALDIGCGRGAVLFPLARAVGAAGSVTGIDLSPNMIAATSADAAHLDLEAPLDIRVGDAQSPDLPARSFDVITSSLVLFFLPDPASALAAWRPLLDDGGRIGVSTFGGLSPSWEAVDAVFAPYLPEQMADPRALSETSPFGSDAGVERLLTDAGFNNVRTASISVRVGFEDAAHWKRWTMSTGQRRMWGAVPPEEHEQVLAKAAERLEDCRDDQGRIGFDQEARYTLGDR